MSVPKRRDALPDASVVGCVTSFALVFESFLSLSKTKKKNLKKMKIIYRGNKTKIIFKIKKENIAWCLALILISK